MKQQFLLLLLIELFILILPCLCFSCICKTNFPFLSLVKVSPVISLLFSPFFFFFHFESIAFIVLDISKRFTISTFLSFVHFKFGNILVFKHSSLKISMFFQAFQFSLFSLITLSSESFLYHASFLQFPFIVPTDIFNSSRFDVKLFRMSSTV